MYTIEGLENGIISSKNNITLLEDAIEKERLTIKNYRGMIDSIADSDRKVKEANAGVHVEVVNDDQD